MKLIFEKSIRGRQGVTLPDCDVPEDDCIPEGLQRESSLQLPELSELDVVRHFTELSKNNFGVDSGFYPLGSCTMKYNPKITESIATLDGFMNLHPFLPQLRHGGLLVQGALQVMHEFEQMLCEIGGMDAFTLHPMAGAHGELTGMMLIAAYHRDKGNKKRTVLIPDEAHGTNPSSASLAGFRTQPIPTHAKTGMLDVEALKQAINDETAAIMLTNPNTLGIFNSRIQEVTDLAHQHDALVYYDGANLNAILGRFRPGDAGVDVMHINLHKTFATPHGGGGPGAGPVGVKSKLEPYLPISRVQKRKDNSYTLAYDFPKSIGYIAPFYGNFLVVLRAYAYCMTLGRQGLLDVSANAVLNANYLMHQLKPYYDLPFEQPCMHECVFSARKQAAHGVHAMDIAKALMDRGFHPPTVYFPLIVKEAMMMEPTECESKETLDAFIEAMKDIAHEADNAPDRVKAAPLTTPIARPDEKEAVKSMNFANLPDKGSA